MQIANEQYAQLRSRLDATEAPVETPAELQTRTPSNDWGELFVASQAFRDYDGRGSSGEVILEPRDYLFTRAAVVTR